jgi:ATP-dependent Clp protease adaptor protein ClpS
MDHVVRALVESVPELSIDRAAEIMLEAHQTGAAVVVTCPLELAELYRDRLQTFGLTATVEPA